jgi:hypothetical protein
MTACFDLALPGLMALLDRARPHAKVSEAGDVLWRTNYALGVSGKHAASEMGITPSVLSRQIHTTGVNLADTWNMPQTWRRVVSGNGSGCGCAAWTLNATSVS